MSGINGIKSKTQKDLRYLRITNEESQLVMLV